MHTRVGRSLYSLRLLQPLMLAVMQRRVLSVNREHRGLSLKDEGVRGQSARATGPEDGNLYVDSLAGWK